MLYICATPIGNLEDVTLRVLETLRTCDLVACEDTRHTRKLLQRHGIEARLQSFHEHNEEQRTEALLTLLREGKEVALVSDAGMPGVSDPGFTLVRACAAEGLPVTVLPGPSAVVTALVLSGLPSDCFTFVGFLPRGKNKLVERLALYDETGSALVAFESPRRLRASLGAIAERWPTRQIAVCRELTKLHEEVVRGTPADVLARLAEQPRGEIVLVLEPWPTAAAAGTPAAPRRSDPTQSEEEIRETLAELLAQGVSTKTAAGIVSRLTGLPNRRVYGWALEVKEGR